MADVITTTDTDDQRALRDVARRFVAKHGDSARLRQAMADPAGYDAVTWQRLAGELGLVGLAVSEPLGGVGASLVEVAVVVAELGRALLAVPYLSTAVAAALVADGAERAPELAADVLPGLIAGDTIAALAVATADAVTLTDRDRLTGTARLVLDAPMADLLVVRAGERLFAVDRADAVVQPVATIDPTRRHGDITLADAPARPLPGSGSRAEDIVRTMLAVEAVGGAEHALEITVAYLNARVQFGRPIGSFQALKHRCADLAVGVASASATAAAAVRAAADGTDELDALGPVAKLYCADVFMHVAAEMIQLHGGIGFTWEHDAHLYFKRAKCDQLQFGTPSELRRLIGRRAGLLPG